MAQDSSGLAGGSVMSSFEISEWDRLECLVGVSIAMGIVVVEAEEGSRGSIWSSGSMEICRKSVSGSGSV